MMRAMPIPRPNILALVAATSLLATACAPQGGDAGAATVTTAGGTMAAQGSDRFMLVDGARLLALVHGVRETATLARLRGLTACGALDPADGEAYAEAYQFLQLLRLQRHQRQQQAGEPYSNLLDPAQLNPLDRRILRESLRQAKRLQASLAYRFPA